LYRQYLQLAAFRPNKTGKIIFTKYKFKTVKCLQSEHCYFEIDDLEKKINNERKLIVKALEDPFQITLS
jgi:hypothetical protein